MRTLRGRVALVGLIAAASCSGGGGARPDAAAPDARDASDAGYASAGASDAAPDSKDAGTSLDATDARAATDAIDAPIDAASDARDVGAETAADAATDAAAEVATDVATDVAAEAATDAATSDGPPAACDGPPPRFATRVVATAFGPGQSFGQDQLPGIVLGPPRGGGSAQGSTDVASLGDGGSITLGFDGAIVDGPGPDFIVFENPFAVGGNLDDPYAELATVAVSDDGETWTSFPCTATAPPYGSCAGWHYVYANADTNDIDPTDPAVAGGDAFDLADIGVVHARFVRITDRPDLPTVFDLDAVSIVHGACD
jgi:hypothetical protein